MTGSVDRLGMASLPLDAAVDRALKCVSWSIAGELDSPIEAEKLAAARARAPEPFADLLARHCHSGNMVVIGEVFPPGVLLDRIMSHISQNVPHTDESVWLKGWSADFESKLQNLVDRLENPVEARAIPRLIILERPDLSIRDGYQIDGLACRTLLHQFQQSAASKILIVTVGVDAFTFHDPYPGWLKIAIPLNEGVWSRAYPLPSISDGPGGDQSRLVAVVAAAVNSGGDINAPLLRLFGSFYPGCGIADLPLSEQILQEIGADQIRSLLRSIISANALSVGNDGLDCQLQSLVLATARLYAALHLLERDGPRKTFVNLDAGRWFCLLRSVSYETLAVVAARLEREDFSGANLMHAPPLAFGRFCGATFESADLYRVDFAYADLRGANLHCADLSRSHLKGADLRNCDLSDADLSYTSLELADLRGANTAGADFYRSFDDHARRS